MIPGQRSEDPLLHIRPTWSGHPIPGHGNVSKKRRYDVSYTSAGLEHYEGNVPKGLEKFVRWWMTSLEERRGTYIIPPELKFMSDPIQFCLKWEGLDNCPRFPSKQPLQTDPTDWWWYQQQETYPSWNTSYSCQGDRGGDFGGGTGVCSKEISLMEQEKQGVHGKDRSIYLGEVQGFL